MKHLKTLSILIVIFFSVISVGCTTNKEVKLSKKAKLTINCLQQGDTEKIFDALEILSKKERYEVIKWMQKNPEKVEPIYYMYFADEIFAKNKDEAVLWYFIGRIRATEDVQMCTDKTASSQIDMFPLLAPDTLEYVSQKDYKYFAQTVKSAIAWDEVHKQRVNPIWSCYHGLDSYLGEPKLLPMNDYEKIQKQTRQDILNSLKMDK